MTRSYQRKSSARWKGEEDQGFYTIGELAEYLNIPVATIQNRVYYRHWPKPAKKSVSGVKLWSKEQALELLKERVENGPKRKFGPRPKSTKTK